MDNPPKEIIALGCAIQQVMGITLDDICSPTRKRKIADARRIFCYIAGKYYAFKQTKIARLTNINRVVVIYYQQSHLDLESSCAEYREAYRRILALLNIRD